MLRLGFIGTGALTAAFVHGLKRNSRNDCEIALSPRSEELSTVLASRYPNVRRMWSNADVVDASDIIFLGVRPTQLIEAVKGLPFRPHHIVVSLIAGIGLKELEERVHPSTQVHRLMTMPTITLGRGPLLMFPPGDNSLRDILRGLGELIFVGDENSLITISNSSGLMSTYLALQEEVTAWIAGKGIPRDSARRYVSSMFDGLAAVALEASREGMPPRLEDYETKQGLNEFCREFLRDREWYSQVYRALDGITARQASMALPEKE
jgi:pyrroline-5-carboxylate reductase